MKDFFKTRLSYDQVLSWGAANSLGAKFVKKLFNEANELSLDEFLKSNAHPHFKCWILLHGNLLPEATLSAVAQQLAEQAVQEARQQGVFLDFRTEDLLQAKRDWMQQKISTSALSYRRQTAFDIMTSLNASDNEEASRIAETVYQVLETDAASCCNEVYFLTNRFDKVLKEHLANKPSDLWLQRLQEIVEIIKAASKTKSFQASMQRKFPLEAPKASLSIFSDETDPIPVGTIISYAGEVSNALVEKGWLLCNGQTLNRKDYSELFDVTKTSFGSSNSEVFQVPDLQGVFVRCKSSDSGRDPDASTRTALYTGGSEGNTVGSYQEYASGQPKTAFKATIDNGSSGDANYDSGCQDTGAKNNKDQNFSASEGGGLETRPVNKYVHYLIKYKNIDPEKGTEDLPIGTVLAFAGLKTEALAQQWLACKGQLRSNVGEDKALFDAIGFSHGGDNEKRFKLPDYQNYFLRGVSGESGRDPDAFNRSAPAPDEKNPGNSGNKVGSKQQDDTALPFEKYQMSLSLPSDRTGKLIEGTIRDIYTYNSGSSKRTIASGGGDAETRPINMRVDWYIKVR